MTLFLYSKKCILQHYTLVTGFVEQDLLILGLLATVEVLVPGKELRDEQVLLQHQERGEGFVTEGELTADVPGVLDENLDDSLDVVVGDGGDEIVPESLCPGVSS